MPRWPLDIPATFRSDSSPRVGLFGWTRDGGHKFHRGVDLLAPVGTPVRAVTDGQVMLCGWENPKHHTSGYGLRVYIKSPDDVWTLYAHLADPLYVEYRQAVAEGAFIGRVGRTGNTSGTPPHLHFEVRLGGIGPHNAVNPEWWVNDGIGHPRMGVTRRDQLTRV